MNLYGRLKALRHESCLTIFSLHFTGTRDKSKNNSDHNRIGFDGWGEVEGGEPFFKYFARSAPF